MAEIAYKYFYSMLIFNVLFGVFGYAFTVWDAQQAPMIDIGLDQESLLSEGIILLNGTSFNVTWQGGYAYFNWTDGTRCRVSWDSFLIPNGDGLLFEWQNIVEKILNTWILPEKMILTFHGTREYFSGLLTNQTLLDYWDFDKQWLSLDHSVGDHIWIKTIESDDGNITKAVYETGILTIIKGDIQAAEDYSILGFAQWYWNNLFSTTYEGIPDILGWIVKIMILINFVSGIIVLRDQTKL